MASLVEPATSTELVVMLRMKCSYWWMSYLTVYVHITYSCWTGIGRGQHFLPVGDAQRIESWAHSPVPARSFAEWWWQRSEREYMVHTHVHIDQSTEGSCRVIAVLFSSFGLRSQRAAAWSRKVIAGKSFIFSGQEFDDGVDDRHALCSYISLRCCITVSRIRL